MCFLLVFCGCFHDKLVKACCENHTREKELVHQRSRMEQVTRPEEKSILTAHNLRCRFCGEYTLRTKEATSSVTKSLPTVTVSHCPICCIFCMFRAVGPTCQTNVAEVIICAAAKCLWISTARVAFVLWCG